MLLAPVYFQKEKIKNANLITFIEANKVFSFSLSLSMDSVSKKCMTGCQSHEFGLRESPAYSCCYGATWRSSLSEHAVLREQYLMYSMNSLAKKMGQVQNG